MLKNSASGADVAPPGDLPGYWTLQTAGWLAFAGLSYLSLNIWYNPGEIIPVLHTFAQSVMGIFVSHPLRWVARATWDKALAPRAIINGAAVLAASLTWTALRLGLFSAMTGEIIGSEDWGGWIFGSLIVFASWAICYHALKYYRQWLQQREVSIQARNTALEAQALAQEETVKRLHAESLVRESKLRILNYQLNPHFFFNSLNSVTALVKRGDKEAAIEMLSRIGDFLRASLEIGETLEHPLRDEIDIISQYLDIEKVRFADRLNTSFEVSGEANDVSIPSLLLQPLIENCIKHAVARSLSRTTIRLTAGVEGARLHLRIANTGVEEPNETAERIRRSPKIGLRNVEERLRSVYGDDYSFAAGPDEEGNFVIRITVPSGMADAHGRGAPPQVSAADPYPAPSRTPSGA